MGQISGRPLISNSVRFFRSRHAQVSLKSLQSNRCIFHSSNTSDTHYAHRHGTPLVQSARLHGSTSPVVFDHFNTLRLVRDRTPWRTPVAVKVVHAGVITVTASSVAHLAVVYCPQ